MDLSFAPKRVGAALFTTVASMMLMSSASAQEATGDALYDQAVLDLLIESRTQKPANQATAEERAASAEELASIYLVSSLPRAAELAETPQLKAQLDLQKHALIFNAFANDFLIRNKPSEQEIFDVYQEQVALAPPKEFKARHILVETQGAAVALVEELDGGADFGELAKTKSTGPSGPNGGDLGWFTAQAMVKPFSDAVALMEDGSYTKTPVQTQFGWHVILREDSRDSTPPPLDSVRDVIVQRIGQQKFQELLESLRAKAAE